MIGMEFGPSRTLNHAGRFMRSWEHRDSLVEAVPVDSMTMYHEELGEIAPIGEFHFLFTVIGFIPLLCVYVTVSLQMQSL